MSSELPEEPRLILSPEELRRVTSFFMLLIEIDQIQKAKQNNKNKEKINESAEKTKNPLDSLLSNGFSISLTYLKIVSR